MTMIDHVIDVDGHVFETPEMWEEYLEEEFQPRRPIMVKDNWGKERWMVDGNVRVRGRGAWNPDSVWEAGCQRPGGYDPAQRIPDMDSEGVDLAVLYGNMALGFSNYPDAKLAGAFCRAYNTWLADHCSFAPERLKGVASLPLQDLPEAERELKRCVEELGFRTVQIQTNVNMRNVDSEAYDNIYHYCQDEGVAVGFHFGGGGAGVDRTVDQYVIAHAFGFTFEGMISTSFVIMTGLLERFPTLRMAILEAGTGWIPYWMERLDEHYERRRDEVPGLTMAPSEYFKHPNLFFACEADEKMLPYTLSVVGEDSIVMATDYPHWDAPFPGAVTGITDRDDISDEQKQKILVDNARRYLGIEN